MVNPVLIKRSYLFHKQTKYRKKGEKKMKLYAFSFLNVANFFSDNPSLHYFKYLIKDSKRIFFDQFLDFR